MSNFGQKRPGDVFCPALTYRRKFLLKITCILMFIKTLMYFS
jgi:hypothetical protein